MASGGVTQLSGFRPSGYDSRRGKSGGEITARICIIYHYEQSARTFFVVPLYLSIEKKCAIKSDLQLVVQELVTPQIKLAPPHKLICTKYKEAQH